MDENDGEETFRIDVSCYYLYETKIPGTSKSKLENLFKLAKVVLCIIHSNAEEESLFSRVKEVSLLKELHLHLMELCLV